MNHLFLPLQFKYFKDGYSTDNVYHNKGLDWRNLLLYVVLYKAGKDCLYTRVRAKKVDGRDGIGAQLGATQA